jgi:hypothetical protein
VCSQQVHANTTEALVELQSWSSSEKHLGRNTQQDHPGKRRGLLDLGYLWHQFSCPLLVIRAR